MRNIDSKLTSEERKILTYLLDEYKRRHRFAGIGETKLNFRNYFTFKLNEIPIITEDLPK
ncbi:MAG: hypothetical protein ACXAEX_20765 [Promethearchaeota archaeon]|jgi:hypothetical protein